jgi:hypothetical protein
MILKTSQYLPFPVVAPLYLDRSSYFHFDILREEYMNIRMNLLKKTLGKKANTYLKKFQPAPKPPEDAQN